VKLGNKPFYIMLASTSGVFLWLHYLTGIDFMMHLSAIPLEALVVVFIVERILDNRESDERRKQLRYIKSALFRVQMRDLFISNISGLKYPALTMSKIRNYSLNELKKVRAEANKVEYKSLEKMERVIAEYVKAEPVWSNFLHLGINFNFEGIIRDMTIIQHFIQDVKKLKCANPDGLFIYEAAKDQRMMKRVEKILGDGIRKFLDYLIELKEGHSELFDTIVSDYEVTEETDLPPEVSPLANLVLKS
jgi:hypothetical protein